MKAKVVRAIRCPGCGSDSMFPVEHLIAESADQPFGPWPCRTWACGTVIRGVIHPDGTADIDVHTRGATKKPLRVEEHGVVTKVNRTYARSTVRLDDGRIVEFSHTAFHGNRGQRGPHSNQRVVMLYSDDSGYPLMVRPE